LRKEVRLSTKKERVIKRIGETKRRQTGKTSGSPGRKCKGEGKEKGK